MRVRVRAGAWALTGVPVLHVSRSGDRHSVRDLLLDARLELTPGTIVDSAQLQTLIRERAAAAAGEDLELCALAVARECLIDGVATAVVTIRAHTWNRLDIAGRPRDRDLIGGAAEQRTARATLRAAEQRLAAGFSGMRLLAPGNGAADIVAQLTLDAVWTYGWKEIPFDTQYQQVRRVLTEAYAERDGDEPGRLAVELGEAVLDESPAVRSVEIALEVVERSVSDPAGATGRAGARTLHERSVVREEATD